MVTQENFYRTIEFMKQTLFSSKKHHISFILLSIKQIHIILKETILLCCFTITRPEAYQFIPNCKEIIVVM